MKNNNSSNNANTKGYYDSASDILEVVKRQQEYAKKFKEEIFKKADFLSAFELKEYVKDVKIDYSNCNILIELNKKNSGNGELVKTKIKRVLAGKEDAINCDFSEDASEEGNADQPSQSAGNFFTKLVNLFGLFKEKDPITYGKGYVEIAGSLFKEIKEKIENKNEQNFSDGNSDDDLEYKDGFTKSK